MYKENLTLSSVSPVSTEGALIGVVLDLSESMRISMRNNSNGQLSRIGSLSQEFIHVMEDANFLINSMETNEEISLRMFIYGFGFLPEIGQTWTGPIGDVFSIVSNLNQQVNHYRVLQPELEEVWLGEVEQILKQAQVEGNAREELQGFVKDELREQAFQA